MFQMLQLKKTAHFSNRLEIGTQVVTEINCRRDKWPSEIMAQKQSEGLNNNITQIKCYGKHRCCLVCAIFLFTLLIFESFEDRLFL